jgi:hypothetical protein
LPGPTAKSAPVSMSRPLRYMPKWPPNPARSLQRKVSPTTKQGITLYQITKMARTLIVSVPPNSNRCMNSTSKSTTNR